MALVSIVWSQWLLASNILRTMNLSVDPCQDFAEYACGNYSNLVTLTDDEASMNSFVETDKLLRRQVQVMLETPIMDNDTQPVIMVKKYYQSCTNVEKLESVGLKPMHDMVKRFGGLPMLDGDQWNSENFDIMKMLVKTYREWGMSRIIRFAVTEDAKNVSTRLLQIDQPLLGLGKRDYYLNASYAKPLNAYKEFLYSTAVQLGVDSAIAKIETDKIMAFETRIANATVRPEDRRNQTELYNPMSVKELKALYPSIPFDVWFKEVANYGMVIDDDEIVDVEGTVYLDSLVDILADTDSRVIANYLIMSGLLDAVSYLAPSLRNHYLKYREAIYGSKTFRPRWEECVITTRTNLDWPVAYMYIKRFFNPDAKAEMDQMVDYLRLSMKHTIQNADWMDNDTKTKANKKLKEMLPKIAYPDYINDQKRILIDFDDVNIDETQYFASSMSSYLQMFNHEKRQLKSIQDRQEWHVVPSIVNAYYGPQENAISFPAGILQNPFFILSAPRYVNFGRIGTVIGHEITHGYDDEGRQYDGSGNLNLWWSTETLQRYKTKTECVINQYSSITDKRTGLNLNGELEVGENIADNGGVKIAYEAYQMWRSNQTFPEPILPFFSNYSFDQMFFISYAQLWCDVTRPEYQSRLIITDPHAPSKYRINVPLQNFPVFAKAFQCQPNTAMNPNKQCTVW